MVHNDNNYSSGAHSLEYFAQYDSSISNGEARMPICICIDTSRSMGFLINDDSELEYTGGKSQVDGSTVSYVKPKYSWVKLTQRIDQLKKVLSKMIDNMLSNEIISRSAVICIVTFDQFARCFMEFSDVNRLTPAMPNSLNLGRDVTNMAKGIEMALERLDRQVDMNALAGNDSYVPLLIFMSDGMATDGEAAERARREVRRRSDEGTLNVLPIGIGSSVSKQWLASMSHDNYCYQMERDNEFERVFSDILTRVQQTTAMIALDEGTMDKNIELEEDDVANTPYGTNYESFLEDFINQEC